MLAVPSAMAPSRRRNKFGDLVDHLVGVDALRDRFVTQDQPVAQAVMHHGAHMEGRDELLAVEPRAYARTTIQRQAAARAGADLDPCSERVAVAIWEPRGVDDVDDIFLRQIRDEDAIDLAARVEDGLLRHRRRFRSMVLWPLRILLAV